MEFYILLDMMIQMRKKEVEMRRMEDYWIGFIKGIDTWIFNMI